MSALQKIIDIELKEVGYIEKASNANLDSETANKGLNNYTKYSRDINALGLKGYQGSAWCCTHQFWVEVQAVGLEKALKNWNMTKSNYVGYNCFETYNKFKAAGKTSSKPKLGCLVVFTFSHIGRVIEIDGDYIVTVEGNTSSATYDRNGGMVAKKRYKYNDSKIKGYCIIDYNNSNVNTSGSTSNSSVLKKGSSGSEVKELQNNLNKLGYNCGTADGDFGQKTLDAVKKFQKDKGLECDGIVGNATKAKIKECVETLNKPANNTTSSSASSKSNANVLKGQKWLNANYSSIIIKATGKKLTENGIFTSHDRNATLAVWKDVMNRKYDATFTVSNTNFGDSCKLFAKNALVKKGVSGTFTYLCQFLLASKGFYTGDMNAECGNVMADAIGKYQTSKKMSCDKQCGANTWYSLFN